MKKILNEPTAYVDEMLDGLCLAHPSYYQRAGTEGRVIVRAGKRPKGKVGIVTGGGSGHLPVFTGYVGEGLADACAIGEVAGFRAYEARSDPGAWGRTGDRAYQAEPRRIRRGLGAYVALTVRDWSKISRSSSVGMGARPPISMRKFRRKADSTARTRDLDVVSLSKGDF